MSSDQYVKARGGPNNITIYYTDDNRLMIRSGGKDQGYIDDPFLKERE